MDTPFSIAERRIVDACGCLADIAEQPGTSEQLDLLEAAFDEFDRALSYLAEAGYEQIEVGGEFSDYKTGQAADGEDDVITDWAPNFETKILWPDAAKAHDGLTKLIAEMGITPSRDPANEAQLPVVLNHLWDDKIAALRGYIKTNFANILNDEQVMLDSMPEPA